MQEGKHDLIARCLAMSCKTLPPSSLAPLPSSLPLHSLRSSYPAPWTRHTQSHLGKFTLTVSSAWKVPPLSLCMASSFLFFSFSSGLNLGRAAFPDCPIFKGAPPLFLQSLYCSVITNLSFTYLLINFTSLDFMWDPEGRDTFPIHFAPPGTAFGIGIQWFFDECMKEYFTS